MYHTSMTDELERLDAALLHLRRFLDAPRAADRVSSVAHGEGRVEISTLLVVDAIARRSDDLGCCVGQVAESLHVAPSTASRLVERAVRAGMVLSDRSTSDPRRAVLRLTDAGSELQQHAVRFRTGRLAELMADWSTADVSTFTRLLELFAAAAHPSPPKERP